MPVPLLVKPANWCTLETGLVPEGIELIFKESIRINDKDSNEQDALN
jgi:hypothetical protein